MTRCRRIAGFGGKSLLCDICESGKDMEVGIGDPSSMFRNLAQGKSRPADHVGQGCRYDAWYVSLDEQDDPTMLCCVREASRGL